MIKVFGHISPDTDATVSAILWAWYLNTHTTQKAEAFVLGSLNKETQFVLQKWGVSEPALLETLTAEDSVVIVDTNNPQELLPQIGEANIVQIIDHHMLTGGLSTKKPIAVTLQPVASTATVIYDLIGSHELPKDMAGLLLSAILSDTLAFRSPTTTAKDKTVAETLASQLGIDINTYANEMFKAKSDVSDFTDIGLIHIDSKKFDVGNVTLRISVVETTDPQSILERKEGIINAIEQIKSEDARIKDVLFFIVDILKEESTVFTYNDFTRQVVAASFGTSTSGETQVLPGVVSRKKQIVPALTLPN
jgi:manganese-dependent inorganic pyrophosphatase